MKRKKKNDSKGSLFESDIHGKGKISLFLHYKLQEKFKTINLIYCIYFSVKIR